MKSTIQHPCSAFVLALCTLAVPASALEIETVGAVPAEVQTGKSGDWNYAVRQTLHTKLPSTPSSADSLYNALHRPIWGGTYSGVASLFLATSEGDFGCTGSLLSTGRHILTAAHCVTDSAGVPTLIDGEALFPSINAGGYRGAVEGVTFSSVAVHPLWNGRSFLNGNDVAVITLDAVAPASVQRYELYTGTSEQTQIHTKVGWGQVGLGNGTALFSGGFRYGQNTYDASGDLVDVAFGAPAQPGILYYDFDNGLFDNSLGYAPNDAFGYWFGINHLGLGLQEVNAAPGDSGGPTFIDGKLAGITSFGLTFWDDSNGQFSILTSDATDPTLGPDSSYGEFGGDTRVSYHAKWINAQTIPEPQTYALLMAGLCAVAAVARRRRESTAGLRR